MEVGWSLSTTRGEPQFCRSNSTQKIMQERKHAREPRALLMIISLRHGRESSDPSIVRAISTFSYLHLLSHI
jgi:hypothetical protein